MYFYFCRHMNRIDFILKKNIADIGNFFFKWCAQEILIVYKNLNVLQNCAFYPTGGPEFTKVWGPAGAHQVTLQLLGGLISPTT